MNFTQQTSLQIWPTVKTYWRHFEFKIIKGRDTETNMKTIETICRCILLYVVRVFSKRLQTNNLNAALNLSRIIIYDMHIANGNRGLRRFHEWKINSIPRPGQ